MLFFRINKSHHYSSWFGGSSNKEIKDYDDGNSIIQRCYGFDILVRNIDDGGRFLNDKQLNIYRNIGDTKMDCIFHLLHTENKPVTNTQDLIQTIVDTYNNNKIKNDNSSNAKSSGSSLSKADIAMIEFYDYYYVNIPSWVNIDAIQRGQNVLLSYLPSIAISLFYRSLIPGLSISKIAPVLLSTGYLASYSNNNKTHNVRKRLIDAGAFISAITLLYNNKNNNNDITKCIEFWKVVMQVRVLHAKVRYTLLHRSSKSKKQWDIDTYGVPINQEDMAVTLLAFSYNAMLGSEFILGMSWTNQERLDYLHFWRYIGWLLGIDTISEDNEYNIEPEQEQNDNNSNSIDKTITNIVRPLDPCGPGWIDNKPDILEHAYSIFFHV